ncbi:MAG: sigma-54-dependent Fis family transcriptional regulator [Hyphomicrobium sp.]
MGRDIDQRQVRRAWETFLERGDVPDLVRTDVAASWKRCNDFHISVESDGAPLLAEDELLRRREAHRLLAKCAKPVFDRASKFMNESISMMILTDASGLIIDTKGDDRAIDAGREIHLEHGGRWGEADIGTNAIGTAVAMQRPVQINGAEHFCSKVQRWTCAAAPIRHPDDGNILGVVDISGPAQHFSSQSLALAMVMSEYIQSLMGESCKFDRDCLLEYYRNKQSKWLNEDVLVVDRRGIIVHATDNAVRLANDTQSGIRQGMSLPNLKELPFNKWQSHLSGMFPTARTDIVSVNDCELGALILLRNQKRGSAKQISSPPSAMGRTSEIFCPAHGNSNNCDATCRHKEASFVASDPAVALIVRQVKLAAPRRMPILIRGETGTGKEELARFAHAASGRKGAFVPLNCAAMPENLIEAELFGYVEGSFTGARRGGSPGLIKEADGGTLFLDEIGDMPISLQPVLLRFLDDWTARPIGGSNFAVDVLIVAATNAKLDRAIADGRFRSDLLYRLNTLDVALPSLADRSDFEGIVRHLLHSIDPSLSISEEAVANLVSRRWPGNIRELRNVLARLSLSAVEGVLQIDTPASSEREETTASDSRLWDLQRARVLNAFEETQGNVSETARRLGISRNTVYRALGKTSGR